MSRKIALGKLIGWGLSALLLVYVVRSIKWEDFLKIVERISVVEVVCMCAIYLCGMLVRGVRWQILLPTLSYGLSTAGVVIGYATNNVLPARLGEFVRADVVGRRAGIKRSTAFATVVVERIFDGVIIVGLFLVGVSSIAEQEWVRNLRFGGGLLFSGLFVGSIIMGRWGHLATQHIPAGKMREMYAGLIEGLRCGIRSPLVFLGLIVTSLLVWLIEGGMFAYALHVLHLPATLLTAYFVLGAVNLAVLLPSSPGGVGVFQVASLLALTTAGVSDSEAAAFGILVHVCQLVPVTVIGLFLLPRFGYRSVSELQQSGEAASVS